MPTGNPSQQTEAIGVNPSVALLITSAIKKTDEAGIGHCPDES
ncbi:MAG: hypothetical protein OSA92_17040 [Pirellulaceae bacterium]|nr:hypothetical protein [Pirellulaceae bacterium]